MNLLHKIARPVVLFSALSLSACNDDGNPEFADLVVTSEHYQNNKLNQDAYAFTAENESEIFHFKCTGDYAASLMDSVINSSDKIRVRVDGCRRGNNDLNLVDIILVNGKKVNW